MILINFGKWDTSVNNRSTWGVVKKKIYFKKYMWTPFVIIKFQILKEEQESN
jgi:hypothetical protein